MDDSDKRLFARMKAAAPTPAPATPAISPLADIGFQNAAKNAAPTKSVFSSSDYMDDFARREKARFDQVIADKTAAEKAAKEKAAAEALAKEKALKVSGSVSAEPKTPAAVAVTPAVATVKTAPIDTILFNDDSVPIEVMTDLIFENIGGQELINIARNDIVNGQKVSYQPIKNLSSIQQQYNHSNILGIQNTSDKYFSNFPIKLENKIPDIGNGPNGSNVYLDSLTGSLVIETVNMENDEQIEVEITVSGIIYEAEFGEVVS